MRKSAITLLALAAILTFNAARAAAQDSAAEGGKLYFSFISSAYYLEKKWGNGMPLEGIKRVAEIAHANKVPVTWLVNARSSKEAAALFTQYHEQYGDDVGFILTANEADAARWGGESMYIRNMPKEKLKKWVDAELAEIKKNLPWATITIAGSGYRSRAMVEVFESAGIKAMWGSCWEQTNTDGISDRGAPWGFYYINRDAYKTPSTANGGLVSVEWTARDLNNAFREGKPEVYSTDPNDVERSGLAANRNIDYWKGLVSQYRRNTKFNAIVPLMVHQEAHEMECGQVVCAYKEDQIKSTSDMLDELFKYAAGSGAEIVTASKAVEAYRAANASTPPTYALFKDVSPAAANKELFIYYDKNGELFFDQGKSSPTLIRNYIGATDKDMNSSEFGKVEDAPVAAISEDVNDADITLRAEAPADFKTAYGLAFWGDYEGCVLGTDSPAGTKILENKLVFVPAVLDSGDNTVLVKLDCKASPWNQ